MNLVMARSVAFACAVAGGALSAFSQPARADDYAFAETQDSGYATLSLLVGKTWINISTEGFQGWVSTNSFNIGGPIGANTNYMAGVYDHASYNDYFGFNLSALGSKAKVTSAKLTVSSGLINETVNYTLFDATQWISELETGFSPNNSLYHDLETGPDVDPTILSADTTNPTAPLAFTLNGLAVSGINAAIENRTMMFALSGHVDVAESAPEPSTWILMLAGFAGLGFVARRQATKRRAPAPTR
jgi:PEP-CTERM motif-containing protein